MHDEERPILDVHVGDYAVTRMCDGSLEVARVEGVYPPNTEGQFYSGHPTGPRPYQCIALEGIALIPSSLDNLQIFKSKVEADVAVLREQLARAEAELFEEKQAHVATREKLASIRNVLRSL